MAIQVKKGIGHSLTQSDFIGTVTVNAITRVVTPTITAGQVVKKASDGSINTTAVNSAGINGRLGLAVNSSTDGDVIESGKVGAYAFDGNSVYGTDQSSVTINATNYVIGSPVYLDQTSAGNITNVLNTNNVVLGVVDSIGTVYAGQLPITVVYFKAAAL